MVFASFIWRAGERLLWKVGKVALLRPIGLRRVKKAGKVALLRPIGLRRVKKVANQPENFSTLERYNFTTASWKAGKVERLLTSPRTFQP